MKQVFVIIVLILCYSISNAKIVSSTEAGGEWNNPASWESGKVPGDKDDVIIKGVVVIKTDIKAGTITVEKGAKLIVDSPKEVMPVVENNVELSGELVINSTARLAIHGLLNRTDTGKVLNNGIIELGK